MGAWCANERDEVGVEWKRVGVNFGWHSERANARHVSHRREYEVRDTMP